MKVVRDQEIENLDAPAFASDRGRELGNARDNPKYLSLVEVGVQLANNIFLERKRRREHLVHFFMLWARGVRNSLGSENGGGVCGREIAENIDGVTCLEINQWIKLIAAKDLHPGSMVDPPPSS